MNFKTVLESSYITIVDLTNTKIAKNAFCVAKTAVRNKTCCFYDTCHDTGMSGILTNQIVLIVFSLKGRYHGSLPTRLSRTRTRGTL